MKCLLACIMVSIVSGGCGSDPLGRLQPNDTLREACSINGQSIPDVTIRATLIEADSVYQAGYSKLEAINGFEANCTNACIETCDSLADTGDCGPEGDALCTIYCTNCSAAIIQQVYGY